MFDSILRLVAEELTKRGISYMIIGGQAVLVYGEPRATRDIDVTLGIGPDQVDVILNLANVCGWRARPESPREFARQNIVRRAKTPFQAS